MARADQTLGVAVIGSGARGAAHSRAWAALGDDVRVVAVADVDTARAAALAQEFEGVTVAADYRAAIDRPDVAVVSVCTPAAFHAEAVLFAAAHGKHIVCEKPLALSLEAGREMIAATRAAGVQFTVNFQRRYAPINRELGRLIRDGAIGRPVLFREMGAAGIRPKRAMHDMVAGNAGPVVDTLCHSFDLWRDLTGGAPTQVIARGRTFARGRPEMAEIEARGALAPDTVALIVEFDSGDLAVASISWGLPPDISREGSRMSDILGPAGIIYPTLAELVVVGEGGASRTIGPYTTDLQGDLARDFVAAVREQRPPLVAAEDGLVALAVSLAALDALSTGSAVAVT